jgi:hypothetical protein
MKEYALLLKAEMLSLLDLVLQFHMEEPFSIEFQNVIWVEYFPCYEKYFINSNLPPPPN